MGTPGTRTERPHSAPGLLDREEERALEELQRTLVSAGDDLCALGEVRELVRRHPGLTLAASAALGMLLAPLVSDAARTALPALLRQPRFLSAGTRALGGLVRRSARDGS